jgi:prepilin-type N-terminal cleavage/methylation domain-containing protein
MNRSIRDLESSYNCRNNNRMAFSRFPSRSGRDGRLEGVLTVRTDKTALVAPRIRLCTFRWGFTLIQLLVVLAIISVLVALLLPAR